jgi:AcrR family transcriptional regulator
VSHRERRPKQRRLTREESRRALLDEGLRMVDEHPVGPGLDHIHPAAVAANLGLTSGAVYHHWESYDDFRDELLEELLAASRFPAVAAYDDEFVAELTEVDDISKLIVAVTESAWREVLDDHRQLRTNLGLWARDESAVTDRLAEQYRHLAKDWASVIGAGLSGAGLEPRSPFTMDEIVTILAALVEGLAVRITTETDRDWTVADGSEQVVSLFSAAALAFLASATSSADDEGDLWHHAAHTIGRGR